MRVRKNITVSHSIFSVVGWPWAELGVEFWEFGREPLCCGRLGPSI